METQQIMSFEITGSAEKNAPEQISEHFINETIDNVLSSLGTECKQAIYDHLEKNCNVKTSDIANHPTEFSEALERIFGGATALIEMHIMKRLHQKTPQFKLHPEHELTLPDYMKALKRSIHTQNKTDLFGR